MKYSEIKGFSVEELNKKVKEMRLDLFESRMKGTMGQLNNPLVIRKIRRDIARFKTALSAKLME